jgi:hypothetical protein
MHRFAPFPIEALVSPIADNAAQPGAKFVRFAQKPEVFPGGDERFLRHILALAEMSDPAVSQGTNQYLVALDDPAEGVAVAGDGV